MILSPPLFTDDNDIRFGKSSDRIEYNILYDDSDCLTDIDWSQVFFLKNIGFASFIDEINKKLLKLVLSNDSDKISHTIYNNSLHVINSLSPIVLEQLSLDNIFSSSNGTVIFEWVGSNENDIFSLEIGKQFLGYFSEKNGLDLQQIELASIEPKKFDDTIQVLSKDLLTFLQ